MKFTKHQKETLRLISSGVICDIISYIKYFNYGHIVSYDINDVTYRFAKDTIPKFYYSVKGVKDTKSHTLAESDFLDKLDNKIISEKNYEKSELQLELNTGKKLEKWADDQYSFDFYAGVYIANSFDKILEFLVLWQFLKTEMLIFEVPQKCSPETLGLFYLPEPNISFRNLTFEEQKEDIDFNNFTYSDKHYCGNTVYQLSYEHCSMCQEYLNKKIYSSTKLELYIKHGFKTPEARIQQSALFAAWLAVIVSILLTFAPFIYQDVVSNAQTDAIKHIQENVNEIKCLLEEIMDGK